MLVLDLPTPGGMKGWVDLGDWLHTEMVYPPADGHPSNTNPAVHGRKSNSRPVDHKSDALINLFLRQISVYLTLRHLWHETTVNWLDICTVTIGPSLQATSPDIFYSYPLSRPHFPQPRGSSRTCSWPRGSSRTIFVLGLDLGLVFAGHQSISEHYKLKLVVCIIFNGCCGIITTDGWIIFFCYLQHHFYEELH